MHRTKSELYLSEIISATSKESLFADKLLGFESLFPFPNIYLMDQLPAIFNDFFLLMKLS